MSVLLPRSGNKSFQRVSLFAVASAVFFGSAAWAAVPAVVIDSQQTVGTGFNNPQGLAVNATNQGAIFIADTNNNQMIALLNGYNFTFQPSGITLQNPQAVALDSKGDLFIADTPTVNGATVGRISEITADNTGNLTGGGQVVFQGAPLSNPTALAVDSSGTLFIGDFPASGVGALYSLAPGATAPTQLSITNGPPAQWFPSALLRDSGNNLYFADNGNLQGSNGGVYVVPAAGGAATAVATPSFTLNQPTGLALNAAGDLNILTLLDTGSGLTQQVLIVPAASPSTPYILPTNGINTGSGLAFDANNNLDVADSFNGVVVQLSYGSPTNYGNVNVGQTGGQVPFNFEFNQPATLSGFRVLTGGDTSTDFTQISGGTCKNGAHNSASPTTPYTCTETYEATPEFPGLRTSSIVVRGPGNTILATAPVYEVGFAGVAVTYPLHATTTVTNLQQPQAVAISGDNKTVYVADSQAAKVYSIAGIAGTVATPISTGSIALQAPIGLALDGAGDLFIADFGLGQVVEIPATSGAAPLIVNTGGLLQHPIAITVDNLGNLYIGDAGPAGYSASYSNPGYIVKVPVGGGAAFKLPVPSVNLVYPQSLVANAYTNVLYVGDGGDLSGVGQVDVVLPDGSAAGAISSLPGVTNPSGLAFDPASNLYILDGTANTITGLAIYEPGAQGYPVTFDSTTLITAPSGLAISAGGQSLVVSNIGGGTNNSLVYLNGNRSVLAFGGVPVGSSASLTATEYNVGNIGLVLGNPYYSANSANSAFSILGNSTCASGGTLSVGASCTINAQFTPASAAQTTQQITVNSTAYNSGKPIIVLQGHGTGGSVVKAGKKK
jgi:sugar lactone lactonase YvrE